MSEPKPRVLLTNDDGPPHPRDSPYILGLYRHLTEQLGWEVKTVLPSSQKSWIGKAHQIKGIVKGSYFYPKQDGKGEFSTQSRTLEAGELAEWILLDATPATCANIALYNLYPGQIDLVISGPNWGRNSSAAFALSSGTIGAALSTALSRTRSIALSYGTVIHPTPSSFFEPAHGLSANIIQYLWNNWGKDEGGLRAGEVDLYNINIPMIEGLLSEAGLKIYSTTMLRNSYGRLFKVPRFCQDLDDDDGETSQTLSFQFGPEWGDLVNPLLSSVPVGSDAWALHHGSVSVTPLRASFAEPPKDGDISAEQRLWKMKL